MQAIRLLLADDHALVRAGIRALINQMEGVKVVAESSDGLEALRLIEELQPDIALLDVTMPGLNGFEVLERVSARFHQVRIIILSVHDGREYYRQALSAGAAGYLSKTAASAELQSAIEAVARGETYVSGEVGNTAQATSADGQQTNRGRRLRRLVP